MKNKRPSHLFSAFLCSLALAASAAATDMPNMSSESSLKHGDKSFVEKAAKSGMEEVDISRLAVERASNTQVRDFAQMMVTDHTAANAELAGLASSKGVMLQTRQTNVDKWEKRNGKDFDEKYMKKMVSDHKEAVELFEKEARKGDDMQLTAFANKTLPTLQAHLAKAQDLKKMVK